MDFSKLTTNQRIAAIGAVAALINIFLPWYGVLGVGISAFDSGILAWGGSLLVVVAGTIVALKALEITKVRIAQVDTEQLAVVLAGLGLILILLRWITESSFTRYGLFLGIIIAAAVAYGSYASMTEAGMALPKVDDFKAGDGN